MAENGLIETDLLAQTDAVAVGPDMSDPVLCSQLLESIVISVTYAMVVAVVKAVLTVSSSGLFHFSHFDSPVRTDPVTAKHTANSSIR